MLMSERPTDTVPAEIEEAQLQFENWRRERERGQRIPKNLWGTAAGKATRSMAHSAGIASRPQQVEAARWEWRRRGEERRVRRTDSARGDPLRMHRGDGRCARRADANRTERGRSGRDGVEPYILERARMIAVTAQTRIWVAREPADFRCGIDGLAQVCRKLLESDPFSGALFVFRNR